jgi:hypothetical protein
VCLSLLLLSLSPSSSLSLPPPSLSHYQVQRLLGSPSVAGDGQDGLDKLLTIVSYYKKRNPASKDEEECLENLFDCICSALQVDENKKRFRHAEGMELMLRTLKERKYDLVKCLPYIVKPRLYGVCVARLTCTFVY